VKQKNETCSGPIPGIGVGGIKKNNGVGEFKYDITTIINVIMYPQYNNNMQTKNIKKITTEVKNTVSSVCSL
jgi:hypothetical protein